MGAIMSMNVVKNMVLWQIFVLRIIGVSKISVSLQNRVLDMAKSLKPITLITRNM